MMVATHYLFWVISIYPGRRPVLCFTVLYTDLYLNVFVKVVFIVFKQSILIRHLLRTFIFLPVFFFPIVFFKGLLCPLKGRYYFCLYPRLPNDSTLMKLSDGIITSNFTKWNIIVFLFYYYSLTWYYQSG